MKKLALSALLLLAHPNFALAQLQGGQCSAAQHLISQLVGPRYQEKGMMRLGAGSQMLRFYANTETGTWSLVVFYPNGAACVIASGDFIELLEAEKEGNDS